MHLEDEPQSTVWCRLAMRPELRKTLIVQGHVFDLTISTKSDGREVVSVEGPEVQRLMQMREHAFLRTVFREELERVRAKRRLQGH